MTTLNDIYSHKHPVGSTVYVEVGRGRTKGQTIRLPMKVREHSPPSRKGQPPRYLLEGSRGGFMVRSEAAVYAHAE